MVKTTAENKMQEREETAAPVLAWLAIVLAASSFVMVIHQ